ncbi:MAG: RNA polymerase sigma-70 factor [Tannerella sp.]|jgi:RNA polymerase sigma-70 factor (ECF subfamily)|nr:RNA polymerase sigma-70 factor [Tannerella sp.]
MPEREQVVTIDIDKVKQGDPNAFRDFFTYFYPKLMSLACRFVDEYTANDLVQDIFTSYWERKHLIEADSIRSFLYKWLQNNCLNYLKHQIVVEEYEARVRLAEARVSYWEDMADSNDVLKQVIDKDLFQMIEEAVEKLPHKCAQAFRLCYYNDLSHKEIAAIMNISSRTVEGHIRRAILFLRADLHNLLMLYFMFYSINQ